MINQTYKMVLLAFSKKVNRRKDCKRPESTVTGNVILTISSITIDKFNIPTIPPSLKIPLAKTVSSYQRKSNDVISNIEEFERTYRMRNCCRACILILGKEHYTINFPSFFNLSMIDQALFHMIKAHSGDLTYSVYPSWGKRGIQGNETDWGRVWLPTGLVQPNNTEKSGRFIGQITIVRRSQKRTLLLA